MFQIKTWRAAVGIWQYLSAVDHHGLPRISLGHVHAKTPEPFANFREHCFVKREPALQRARYNFAGNVIFSRAETAGGDHYAGTLHRVFDYFFQTRIVVTNNRLELHIDPAAIELFSQPETVCVSTIRGEQFGTDGDDFSRKHVKLLP